MLYTNKATYKQGRNAHSEGTDLNPYHRVDEHQEHIEWNDGYRTAAAQEKSICDDIANW